VPAFQYDGIAMEPVPGLDAALWQTDCVVIVTDHSLYGWNWVVEQATLIVDTRNTIVKARHRAEV
jgi:UDP-N-acetyl-D-glucosamine dehydrogenase